MFGQSNLSSNGDVLLSLWSGTSVNTIGFSDLIGLYVRAFAGDMRMPSQGDWPQLQAGFSECVCGGGGGVGVCGGVGETLVISSNL